MRKSLAFIGSALLMLSVILTAGPTYAETSITPEPFLIQNDALPAVEKCVCANHAEVNHMGGGDAADVLNFSIKDVHRGDDMVSVIRNRYRSVYANRYQGYIEPVPSAVDKVLLA